MGRGKVNLSGTFSIAPTFASIRAKSVEIWLAFVAFQSGNSVLATALALAVVTAVFQGPCGVTKAWLNRQNEGNGNGN
jgi:hypothetical protein